VTLLDEQILSVGSSAFVATYRGRQVCFASEDHFHRFQSNPDKYWPVLDGYCAVSAIDRRELRPAQPEWAAIYRGRIWFFADPEHRQRFAEAPLHYLTPLGRDRP
jgi:YHS domain-containing protein